MKKAIVTACLLVILSSVASGQAFEYESRYSRVEINGEIAGAVPPWDKFEAEVSATHLDPFDEGLDDDIAWYELSCGATSEQLSDLGDDAIRVVGQAYSYAYDDYGYAGAFAWAESVFEVAFTVETPTPVVLEGLLNKWYGSDAANELEVLVGLYRGGETIYEQDASMPFEVDALLSPASYALVVTSYVYCDLGSGGGDAYISGRGEFDVVLRVEGLPTLVGDMNCDGLVNNFDIDPFVLALTDPVAYGVQYEGCPILNGDMNEDGQVNNFDIDRFVELLSG